MDRNTESLKREKARLGEELEAQKLQMQKMTEEMEAAAEKVRSLSCSFRLTKYPKIEIFEMINKYFSSKTFERNSL